MKAAAWSNVGTVLAAFLAASCCIGPAVFVVFGASVGFLGRFAALEPYRPWFLAAGLAMLAFSFLKLYLQPPDCQCREDRRARTVARVIWWIGLAALVTAAGFQWLLIRLYSQP